MASMTDEESFVILGTSPQPSLASNVNDDEREKSGSSIASTQEISINPAERYMSFGKDGNEQSKLTNDEVPVLQENSKPSIEFVLNGVGGGGDGGDGDSNNKTEMCLSNGSPKHSIQGQTASPASPSVTKCNGNQSSSLAASFILGEINADVLKTSVYSQFPSLCAAEVFSNDVEKLENLWTEYVELKNMFAVVNTATRQFCDKTRQEKIEAQRREQDYVQQLSACQEQIARLRNENLELKKEMESKMTQIQLADKMREEEYAELRRDISDKSSQIGNMRAQIERLEEQNLASFEVVPHDGKTANAMPEYVSKIEHDAIVKEFERKMSVLLAENFEVKDMQTRYIDEINCLKVNLTAAEELINSTRAGVTELRSKDVEKSQLFENFQIEREQLKEEMTLLHEQVEVYRKDFDLERAARETLAGEKDRYLQDIRLLQRRNHELVDKLHKQWELSVAATAPGAAAAAATASGYAKNESTKPTTSTRTTSTGSNTDAIREPSPSMSASGTTSEMHLCPICSKGFTSLTVLQSHVNDCLDKTSCPTGP